MADEQRLWDYNYLKLAVTARRVSDENADTHINERDGRSQKDKRLSGVNGNYRETTCVHLLI